jgi:protocatechuate 3,4-dioxygenase beta subunit
MSESTHDPVPFRPYVAGTQPDNDTPTYGSTRLRHPTQPRIKLPHTITEVTGPRFDPARFGDIPDMTKTLSGGSAMGERIIVHGTITDEDGRPVPNTIVEIWQANAAGRYNHPGDEHDAPLDPEFMGKGRVFTDENGYYRFVTVKPGAYPWMNHYNAWRPNHIHYSYFGPGFASRLITQMYFPGDPLLEIDPIYQCIADEAARKRLVSSFDLSITEPNWALGYRFDVVLRGRGATPMENHQ